MDLIRSIIDKVRPLEEIKNKYFFLESETNGYLPFDTATVKINAFADKQKIHKMGNVSFKWFKNVEGRNYEIDNIEDFYHFSVEDIGSVVIAAVTNMDKPNEVECITFGPIVFDPQVKMEVEKVVLNTQGTFDVLLPYKDTSKRMLDPKIVPDPRDLVIDEILMTSATIQLTIKNQSYSIFLNRFTVEHYSGNSNVLRLKLSGKEGFLEHLDYTEDDECNYCIYIKFFNRIYKETFVAVRKMFLTVRLIPISKELDKLELETPNHSLFKNESKKSLGDMMILYDNLKDTLKRTVNYTKSIIDEKDRIIQYSESLEDELKMSLKELKETFNKARVTKNFDVSKIEKVETSINIAEQKMREKSFRNDKPSDRLITEAKYKKTKEELDKMTKLNDLLAKELKKTKQAQKDRFNKINNSLNYIKDLSAMPDNIQYNTHLQPSFNFSTMDKDKSTARELTSDRLRANVGNIDLMKENEILKSELMELKVKLLASSQSNTQNFTKQADGEFFKSCFNELRMKIDALAKGKGDIQNTSTTYLNESVLDSVYKAGLNNKVELLNLENSSLNRRINHLMKEMHKLRNEQELSTERVSKVSDEEYKQLHIKIEELKKENFNLMKEVRNFEAQGEESSGIYKKQNITLKSEIDNLRQSSIHRENELNLQIDQKDSLIDQINATNNKLVEEINRLQSIMSHNRSLLNLSKSFTDK